MVGMVDMWMKGGAVGVVAVDVLEGGTHPFLICHVAQSITRTSR